MADIMKAVRNLIEAHKQLFDRFMEALNLDEYELSWVSFFTGVAVTLLFTAFV
tara:strand:- start:507 stop:665 length:159 start_codon:yes stop_codon:yes gene_type:complete